MCNVISLYFMCCSVNGSVFIVVTCLTVFVNCLVGALCGGWDDWDTCIVVFVACVYAERVSECEGDG